MTQYPAKAFSILFEYDWGGNGPLFKNQSNLVNELLDAPESSYYTPNRTGVDKEAYDKAHNRLKTYISQIFTADTNRRITKEFKQSLAGLLAKKLPSNYSYTTVVN